MGALPFGRRTAGLLGASALLSIGPLALLPAALVRAESPPRWHTAVVPGGVAALLQAAGLQPSLPRWRAVFEVTRRLHPTYADSAGMGRAQEDVRAFFAAPRSGGSDDRVPLPLAPSFWTDVVFERAVPEADLVRAILAERRAALLYRGLAQLDGPTATLLERERDALREIHRRRADVFSVFAGALRIREGQVVVPGGREAQALWEEAVGERVDRPGRFLVRLLARDDGRLAFLYDSVARLDTPHQRFALGLAGKDVARRGERFRALRGVFAAGEAWWKHETGAFNRRLPDAATLLREVRVTAEGAPAAPAGRAFWEAAFSDGSERTGGAEDVDAAFLAQQMGPPEERARVRLLKLAFGQRVFGTTSERERADALEAVQALARHPALVLSLERMGFGEPGMYAEAVRQADRLPAGGDSAPALAQLQGALAIVERARLRHTLDACGTDELVRSLLAVPLTDKRYEGRLGRWLADTLLPALSRAVYGAAPPGGPEQTVLRALAGAVVDTHDRPAPPFAWEGLTYRADLAGAEWRRLERVRARQEGERLEAVLELGRVADAQPRGKAAGPQTAAADRALAEVLTALAYAPHLGSPDGPALAGASVALRHDFGPSPWGGAEEVSDIGVPWHVRGSLLGLDLTLAGLGLRRLSPDMPGGPPGLDAHRRLAFARTVPLMDPAVLDDRDPRGVTEALARGRSRVSRLAGAPAEVGDVARDAGLDAWREQALAWVIEHEPAALERFFSMTELFWLGRPGPGNWDAWGTPATGADGSWRLRLPAPRPFDDFAGQRMDEAMATRFADLGLRVAADLEARRLPPALAPSLLAFLVQDMAESARPNGHDDWAALAQFVRELPAERIDDMVAALAGDGHLAPALEADP